MPYVTGWIKQQISTGKLYQKQNDWDVDFVIIQKLAKIAWEKGFTTFQYTAPSKDIIQDGKHRDMYHYYTYQINSDHYKHYVGD